MRYWRTFPLSSIAWALFLLAPVGNAADIEKFFRVGQHYACGLREVKDRLSSVCEWDDQKLAANQCGETVPVYKEPHWKTCAHVAMGPLPFDAPDQSGTVPGGAKLRRATLALTDVAMPVPQNLVPDGPWMPTECIETGKKISTYFKSAYAYRRLDAEVPGWRDCMNSFTNAIAQKYVQFPDFVIWQKLQQYFEKMDTSDPAVQSKLDAFVLAVENEPTRPIPVDRALQLLGIQ